MVHLLDSLTPTVAEHSENGQGNGYPNPLTIALCCAVESELVEGDTDCCKWRTGIRYGFIPLLVRHDNSAQCHVMAK